MQGFSPEASGAAFLPTAEAGGISPRFGEIGSLQMRKPFVFAFFFIERKPLFLFKNHVV